MFEKTGGPIRSGTTRAHRVVNGQMRNGRNGR